MLNPKGRDWGPIVNWDSLGKAYTSIIIVWSVFLLAGIAWLILHRREPHVRMRNLPVAIASTAFLWVYLFKIFMAYTTNGHFSCRAEYWIMSIYLPFGIALFQANVIQLRSVAKQQARLLSRQGSMDSEEMAEKISARRRVYLPSWQSLTEAQKGYVFVASFMVVQLVITAAIYATDPVLQGDWTSFGQIPFNKGQALCRKSAAWTPSAFWQLFWSWIYGPYLLFTLRHIHDTHYWRLQTILTVIAGLPGVPLWLAAVYSTAFKPINKWWVPPMWLSPGIMVMQFVTIFFPIYESFEQYAALRRTQHLWDRDSVRSGSETEHSYSDNTLVGSRTSTGSKLLEELSGPDLQAGKDMYRMPALEKALLLNPAPLLVFAATKDFTAENIIFLIHVRDWKRAWKNAPRQPGSQEVTQEAKLQLFQSAVSTYFSTVSERTADFPINIPGPMRNSLDAVFAQYQYLYSAHSLPNRLNFFSADLAYGKFGARGVQFDQERDAFNRANTWLDEKTFDTSVAPFSMVKPEASSPEGRARTVVKAMAQLDAVPELDERVFDETEASVKYLVLTNTWRKFVQASQK